MISSSETLIDVLWLTVQIRHIRFDTTAKFNAIFV